MASSLTPITFNGTSKYAADLQQVITRAVRLATLPLTILQNQKSDTSNKITAVQSLQSLVGKFSDAVSGLSTSSRNTISGTVSDPSVLEATASPGALPGTYTVNVLDAGSFTSAMNSNGLPVVTDPNAESITSSSSFTLTVGTDTFNIQPSANNLSSLAQAINASGAGVQATIINIGGPSQPDYRIALQSTSLGDTAIQLNDGSTDLLDTLSHGSNALYTVNGQPPAGISTDSSTVTIAPGLTIDIKDAGTSTINVALGSSSIASALIDFVDTFNAARSELQKSIGESAGALSGDTTIVNTNQILSKIAGYSVLGSGIQSLSDLGIESTRTGTLTFNPDKLASLTPAQLEDAVSFLGSPTTGGFLKSATDSLNSLLNETDGLLPNQITSLTDEFNNETHRIQDQADALNEMQQSLIQQMNAADAMLASLDQQTSFLTSLFNTINANNYAGH